MKLESLTEAEVRKFAGATIYERGHEYFSSGMVLVCDYDEANKSLRAEVSGNYGDYEVEIAMEKGKLAASCDCLYDGYPCKHIVAVLLSFIHRQSKFIQSRPAATPKTDKLKTQLAALPHAELVQMILTCAEKYSDFKRELLVRFAPNQKATLDTLLKDVTRAFPRIESRSYSTRAIAKQLKIILKSIEGAEPAMQLEVYWAIADRTLRELNEYGMQDEPLENLAADVLEKLAASFHERPELGERKRVLLAALMDYYLWGNSGMSDALYDAVHALCSERTDYQILIAKLEAKGQNNSYYRSQLANLYAKVGDESARRKMLESNLELGADYWRLAEYWLEKGEHAKAAQIVQAGIDKAEGRLDELYDFMQEYYESGNDYDSIFHLLQKKLAKGNIARWINLKDDPTYKCLAKHYAAAKNYFGQKQLLELRLHANRIDLELYKDARTNLKPEDWLAFEKELFERLKDLQQKQKTSLALWSGSSEAEKILTEIYHYKNDEQSLFAVAKPHHDLLLQYEAHLLPQHAEFYAQHYRDEIVRLVKRRGRESYKEAAKLAGAIKKVYVTFLHQPEEWEKFITKLRTEHKALRALQEELRKL